MTARKIATPTTTIQNALDVALSAIRKHNKSVPEALAVTIGTGKGKFHGVFTANAWLDNGGEHAGFARHEIVMAPESFRLGAEQVLTTLIHETAHALAHATDVKDTSRNGRWHNAKFRSLVTDMGLVTEDDSKVGTATPGLMEPTKITYAKELKLLAEALVTYRKPNAGKVATPKTTVRISCECDAPVTVPIKWYVDFGADMLRCDDGHEFTPVGE